MTKVVADDGCIPASGPQAGKNGTFQVMEHRFWDFASRLVGEGEDEQVSNFDFNPTTNVSCEGAHLQDCTVEDQNSTESVSTDRHHNTRTIQQSRAVSTDHVQFVAAQGIPAAVSADARFGSTVSATMEKLEVADTPDGSVQDKGDHDGQEKVAGNASDGQLGEHSNANKVGKREETAKQKLVVGNAKEEEPFMWEVGRQKRQTEVSEVEMLKERFAKLLLGEDMSGGSKGVCQALAISNAITNLSASVFGEHNKLAPIGPERRNMWRRELEWLLCVADYIVELVPAWQTSSSGVLQEVMVTKQRADLHANLPALRKLDHMSLEALESFKANEFWYEKPGSGLWGEDATPGRHQDKWWLPNPRVPAGGLSEDSRRHLIQKRDIAAQVLKAAMAINAQTLAEMEIPDAYCDTLPKSVRSCLGEGVYRVLTADYFSPDMLLAHADLASEHAALEMANKLESSIYAWRRKIASRNTPLRDPSSRHMGEMMRDLRGEITRAEEYADRAEASLLLLRQKCPGLPQTALDGYKIQYNRDVGKSILESYSRVLESLASNLVARIEDVLYVDDAARGVTSQDQSNLSSSHRFSLDIPTVVSSAGSVAQTVNEEIHSEIWELSPLHSPSPSPTPTSPLSVKSDSSFRERMWRRKPPGLPHGVLNPSTKKGVAEYIGGVTKKGTVGGKSTLWRSLSETSADKHGSEKH